MRTILTLVLVILGGAASAASPMDGKWELVSLNRNGEEVELKSKTVVSIKDGKFQTVKDGKIDGDIGTIDVVSSKREEVRIGDEDLPLIYNDTGEYDVVLTDGNHHYGLYEVTTFLLLGDPDITMTTCVNNVPDGERPTKIESGKDINLCVWKKVTERWWLKEGSK